ncbi:MAG TPA: hypothetical protein VMW04_03115 [Patescibacteria group bacterium]|nr:hypothetical protein [Patescibacteria group bacterium]
MIKRLSLLCLFFLLLSLRLPSSIRGQTTELLCCPPSFTENAMDCPSFTDLSKQCCKNHGFFCEKETKDRIPCGTIDNEPLCCPAGFSENCWDCPSGTDITKKCCRNSGSFGYKETADRVPCGSEASRQPSFCCPDGYSDRSLDCPTGTDTSRFCCKNYGLFQLKETISKIPCGSTITGPYCCPEGFTSSFFDCPLGTDLTKTCCKNYGFFQSKITVDKINCTLGTGLYIQNIPIIDVTCDGGTGVTTAIGCIPVDSVDRFVGWLLGKVTFIASGIAFLLMALGAIQITVSGGNPEKVKAGGELITSAISGLLLIILSLFLLKLIGVDILQIPGFRK